MNYRQQCDKCHYDIAVAGSKMCMNVDVHVLNSLACSEMNN